MPFNIIRIFSAVVQVIRYGWSKEAVRAAAEELGKPSVVAGLVKVPQKLATHTTAMAAVTLF